MGGWISSCGFVCVWTFEVQYERLPSALRTAHQLLYEVVLWYLWNVRESSYNSSATGTRKVNGFYSTFEETFSSHNFTRWLLIPSMKNLFIFNIFSSYFSSVYVSFIILFYFVVQNFLYEKILKKLKSFNNVVL